MYNHGCAFMQHCKACANGNHSGCGIARADHGCKLVDQPQAVWLQLHTQLNHSRKTLRSGCIEFTKTEYKLQEI